MKAKPNETLKYKPIVEVTWLDAWSSGADYFAGGDHTGLLTTSVGYEMEWTDVSIVLSMNISRGGEDRGARIMCIPTEYIVKVEELVK